MKDTEDRRGGVVCRAIKTPLQGGGGFFFGVVENFLRGYFLHFVLPNPKWDSIRGLTVEKVEMP